MSHSKLGTHVFRKTAYPLLTLLTLPLTSLPAAAQGDLSAASPLAGDGPLVELLLAADGSRAEMAKRLLQAMEVAQFEPEPCEPGEELFDDVPASSPF